MIQKIRSSVSKFTIQDWVFVVFSLLWVFIILVDYLNKQIVYVPSFKYFRYYRLFGFFMLFGVGLSAYFNRLGFFQKIPKIRLNGIGILALVIGIIWCITVSFNHYWKAPLDYTNYFHLAGMAIFTLGSTLLLLTSAYSIGNHFRNYLISKKEKNLTFILIDISLGLVIYTFVMMILGVFALLNQIILLGFIVLLGLINYKESTWFVRKVIWSKIEVPKDFNIWGGILAFFTLVYLTMNYLYSQAPFPLGFDARNYYVNISKLIADAQGLIEGFQPYAWSLVMSTGYIAFDSPEITMFLSTLGGILALFATYELSTRYLRVDSNMSWLVILLVLVSPTITNHWMIEFKIDLALMFFQLAIVNFVMWWILKIKKTTDKVYPLWIDKRDRNIIILLGILLGYCLSVKVLSVFLVFALFLALWYHTEDLIGMMGLALTGIGAILIVGLDDISGLRDYHLSPMTTGGVCAVLGLGMLIYSAVKNKLQFLTSMKTLVLCGCFMVLTFSPWIYKNYTFTKSTSMMKLLIGAKPSPDISIPQIIKNYNDSKK